MLFLGLWFTGVILALFGHTWIALPFMMGAIITLGGKRDRDRTY